jgi:hypothetical protein
MHTQHDLVLGAGGIKGRAHVGVLQAIEELNIGIGTVTGVSVGAGVATLYTNGLDSDAILDSFRAGSRRLYDPANFMSALIVPTLEQWLVSPSFLSIVGPWRQQVRELGLRPNERLQILAFDVVRARPVLFKGTDYDLATAVAASGSVPKLFAPVPHNGGLLVDGALYHYNPTEFSREPAIVVRLGRATRWPLEPMTPMDAYYHWREMYLPLVATIQDVDESKHIVIDVPCADVAGLSFGASESRCMRLVEEGYEAAIAALRPAIASGRIAVN